MSFKIDISQLTDDQKALLLSRLKAKELYSKFNAWESYFTNDSASKRCKEGYPKSLEFFRAGAEFRERFLVASNRCGKTIDGGYEVARHVTGVYPEWWEGKRFDKPSVWWVCSENPKMVRAGVQSVLYGETEPGTGMIPKKNIVKVVKMPQCAGVLSEIHILHEPSGGTSIIYFMPYTLPRESFQAASIDGVWFDEEPPNIDIYGETYTRLFSKNGIAIATFTPLSQLSPVVQMVMPDGVLPESQRHNGKYVAGRTMYDVPHITESMIEEFKRGIPPSQWDTRIYGKVGMGSGVIYSSAYPVTKVVLPSHKISIQENWPKGYGMDVGRLCTAVNFYVMDPDTQIIYQYDELHFENVVDVYPVARAIMARGGSWMTGVVDPASQRGGDDGTALLHKYREAGLDLKTADNAVDAGLADVCSYLAESRLYFLQRCENTIKEYGVYRSNEKGEVIKKFDHHMDALRYFIRSGIRYMVSKDEAQAYMINYTNSEPVSLGYDF